MARESFADEEVADALNRDFISIKVDREERPDVDAVYMEACQAFTGSGGWPLTILMTPEQKPFFAGTYLPKRGVSGHLGLLELLERAAGLWKGNREGLLETGNRVAELLSREAPSQEGEPDRALLHRPTASSGSGSTRCGAVLDAPPNFPRPTICCFFCGMLKRKGRRRL